MNEEPKNVGETAAPIADEAAYTAQPQAPYTAQPQAPYTAQPQAPYTAQPQAPYTADPYMAQPAYTAQPPVKKKKSAFVRSLKFVIPGIIIIAAVLFCIIYSNANAADKVACEYAVADRAWDYHEMQNYLAYDYSSYFCACLDTDSMDEFLELVSGYEGKTFNTWDDFCANSLSKRDNSLREDYGSFTLSSSFLAEYSITMSEIIDKIGDEEREYIEKSGYVFNASDEYKCVEVRVYFNGVDDTGDTDMEIYLVKDGLGWKVVGHSFK